MLFGYVDGNQTYICGDNENMNKFIKFKEKNHEGHSFVESVDIPDEFEYLTNETLCLFEEELVRINHKNNKDQEQFIDYYKVKILHPYDCQTEQQHMVIRYEDIKERDRNNKIRLDAFAKGEMPKNTLMDELYPDGIDPHDTRTDEEKEKALEQRKQIEKVILDKIAKGENTVPLVTNLDKEDRDAKDMSHIRREQNEDMMEDFDPEEDMVDPDELAAVMRYQEEVLQLKAKGGYSKEEKEKMMKDLLDDLNSKLSDKTIKDREEKAKEIAAARKATENDQFTKELEEAKEKYKNGEHESTASLDREITMDVNDPIFNIDITKTSNMVNKKITNLPVEDLPLTAIQDRKVTLPSGKTPFEIDKVTAVAWQNLKSISRTSTFGMTSITFEIIDDTKDCYVLYCDNRKDKDGILIATPKLVRIKLSD